VRSVGSSKLSKDTLREQEADRRAEEEQRRLEEKQRRLEEAERAARRARIQNRWFILQSRYLLSPTAEVEAAVADFQDLGSEVPYSDLLDGKVQKIYLETLLEQEQLSPALALLQLIILPDEAVSQAAKNLLEMAQSQSEQSFQTILVRVHTPPAIRLIKSSFFKAS
jgi:hypothetical protein